MQIEISKFDNRGYGIGYVEGREYKVLNAIPGEVLEVEVFKKKKGSRFAKVVQIIHSSENRIDPLSSCFAETSPWEILKYQYENQIKQNYLISLYKNNNFGFEELVDFSFPNANSIYGYRNKMEFSFYIENGHISFAFHRRDCKRGKIVVEGSPLMPIIANHVIKKLLEIVNQQEYHSLMPFKSLVVRYSFLNRQTYLILYVNDKNFNTKNYQKFDYPLSIYYSDPNSPASIENELLFTNWNMQIEEQVNQQKFVYPHNSFFQINPEMFGEVIRDIRHYLQKKYLESRKSTLCEYYAGVGTWGIGIANLFESVIAVELTSGSNKFAQINAVNNKINNYQLLVDKSENLAQEIANHKIVLFDPPRIGIHQNLINALNKYKPELIVYLSCNPETQIKDIQKLAEFYRIEFCKGYNFYPRTPHLENLVILKLRN